MQTIHYIVKLNGDKVVMLEIINFCEFGYQNQNPERIFIVNKMYTRIRIPYQDLSLSLYMS